MNRLLVLFAVVLSALALGDTPWPIALPQLRLADPFGHEVTDAQLVSHGLVVVATAPTQAQSEAQLGWHAALKGLTSADGPALAMLEDMSQSWFKPLVISRMKESWRPGSSTLLLLDESGVTRKALGVAENATVAFAFARGGKLVAVETGAPTAERAERLMRAARGP
jgi:hypothetical protein